MRNLPNPIRALAMVALACSVASAADKIVACVGNSITYGYDLARDLSYPSRLDSLLGAGYSVLNFGVSSKTMVRGSNESYWKETAYTNALASKPDIVIIELGTNDVKSYIWNAYGKDFEADFLAMIKSFRDLPTKPQVWINLPPWANNESWGILDVGLTRNVNPLTVKVAVEAAAPLIDLRAGFAGHKDWYMADSVHPNAVGAKGLATLVAGMLQRQPVTLQFPAALGASPQASLGGASYQWYRNDTLLVGDTARTLRSGVAGSYKVSVKLDRTSENRLVSANVQLSSTDRPTRQIGLRVDRSGRVHLAAGALGHSVIEIQDRNGRRVPSDGSLPAGAYLYRIRSGGTVEQGSFVVP